MCACERGARGMAFAHAGMPGRRRRVVLRGEFVAARRPARGGEGEGEVGGRVVPRAAYLDTDGMRVDWSKPDRKGSFGRVFFGREMTTGTDIVIKCPIRTDKAKTLLDVEEHTNAKLARRPDYPTRWADYLGKINVPNDVPLISSVCPYGLVWERAGLGETLEDYLRANRIADLEKRMAVTDTECTPWGGRLRVHLAERVLVELMELLLSLEAAGIVHRDIKPDNIVIDTSGTMPLRCIDFGSSCDWGSFLKTGLFTNTCDPVYSAPEQTLNLMAANKFDVYSVGLITLRCLFPSLTSRRDMAMFVTNDMKECGSFEKFLYAATSGQAGAVGGTRSDAEQLDSSPALAPLRSILCSMLTVSAGERADISSVVKSRFLSNRLSKV